MLACVNMLFEEFPFTEGRALFTPTGAGGRTLFIKIGTLHRGADSALAEVKMRGCRIRGGPCRGSTIDPVGTDGVTQGSTHRTACSAGSSGRISAGATV
jgi:hypothetical protein